MTIGGNDRVIEHTGTLLRTRLCFFGMLGCSFFSRNFRSEGSDATLPLLSATVIEILGGVGEDV